MHSAFNEPEPTRLHKLDYGLGLGFYGAFRGYIKGKVWGSAVNVPYEAAFLPLVKTEEHQLWDSDTGIILCDEVGLWLGVWILPN